MSLRTVSVGSGAGFTNIRATLPCHKMVVSEDGIPAHELEVQFPDDAFATTFTEPAGTAIDRTGPGASGLIGRPADYNASGVPATGDIIMKVRAANGDAITVQVQESVSQSIEE